MLWLAGDVKEPILLSKRVGHEVPGVVVWPLLLHRGLGWEMLGDISYDKASLLFLLTRIGFGFTLVAH